MKKLSVAAIKKGTVIDHIPAGQGMRIVHLLSLADANKRVTLGLNLPSGSMGLKDLIKVEDWEISEEEAHQIAVFAPCATLNIIREYQLAKKFKAQMPRKITKVLVCPNTQCITNHEQMTTRFTIQQHGERVALTCEFCEKSFAHDA